MKHFSLNKRSLALGLGLAGLAVSSVQAAPLAVTISDDVQTCDSMTVTWDITQGIAPWTITVAPVGQFPVSVAVPAGYMPASAGKQWSWEWQVPNYSNPSQVIVAVSDSTGKFAGTSSLQSIAQGTGSCAAPDTTLDFVWYPVNDETAPTYCNAWPVAWQVDKTNNGIEVPVEFVVLGENSYPLQYSAGMRDSEWEMPVLLASGTKFVMAAFDAGKSGTGGVGDVYTVGAQRGSCVSSGAKPSVGLVSATAAASAAPASSTASTSKASSTSSASSSRMTTISRSSGASTAAASTAAPTTSSDDADASKKSSSSSSSSSSNGGAIAGAVIGVLAALALLAAAIIFWRRRKQDGNGGTGRGWPANEVSPWRWEVVDEDKNGGQDGWSEKAPGSPPVGHSSSHPHDEDDVAGVGAAGGVMHHISRPSLSSRNGFPRNPQAGPAGLERPAVARVVPDSMLWPPPPPSAMAAQHMDDPYSAAKSTSPSGRNLVPSHESQQARQDLPAASPSTDNGMTGSSTAGPVGYLPPPPPSTTSIHDPYSHMSQYYGGGQSYPFNDAVPPLPPSASSTSNRANRKPVPAQPQSPSILPPLSFEDSDLSSSLINQAPRAPPPATQSSLKPGQVYQPRQREPTASTMAEDEGDVSLPYL
ncbi:unnamed protein product [Jaminaea pallidilutea]